MAKRNPSNTDLVRIVDEGFSRVDKRLDGMEEKMQTFHDFMIVEQALKKSVRTRGGKLDWSKVVERFLTFLIALIGCMYLLIEFVVKRGSS